MIKLLTERGTLVEEMGRSYLADRDPDDHCRCDQVKCPLARTCVRSAPSPDASNSRALPSHAHR